MTILQQILFEFGMFFLVLIVNAYLKPKTIRQGLKVGLRKLGNLSIQLLYIISAFILPLLFIVLSIFRLSGYDIVYIYGFSDVDMGIHSWLTIFGSSLLIINGLLMFIYNASKYKRYIEGYPVTD